MKIRSRKVNYTSSILHRKQNIASKLGYDISITNETELDNIYSKVQRARLLKLRRNKLKSININTDLMNDKEIWLAYYNDIIIPIFKEKFGEQHPMQSVEGFNQWVTRSYRKKLFTFPSGKTTYIQGCEDIALRELLNVYSESDIVVNKEAMPKIFYMLNGKKRRYFPDIFIPKDNKIFEVKSAYTATLNTDKNAAKQNACKAQGFCFEFMVF